jgi:hypothetical protein
MDCTCSPPAEVDLTMALRVWSTAVGVAGDADLQRTRTLLVQNLQRSGWCPLRVRLNEVPLLLAGCKRLNANSASWKQQLLDLLEHFTFTEQNVEKCSSSRVVYRMAESGAPGSVPEPKTSLEVERCQCGDRGTSSNATYETLQEWTSLLHTLALTVQNLVFGSDFLLRGESCQVGNSQVDKKCNIDLLRAFYYDTVPPGKEHLGSNPHTDWGSWTVVWQDHVGGLQSFCHACQRWNGIPAHESDNASAHFVLHVGDITSLVIGKALEKSSDRDWFTTQGKVVWPSPKHRVLSPTLEMRCSLVYFAYPPPEASINDLVETLRQLDNVETLIDFSSLNSVSIPYETYFLLQNQSSEGNQVHSSSKILESISSKSLAKVLREKWRQVQRS